MKVQDLIALLSEYPDDTEISFGDGEALSAEMSEDDLSLDLETGQLILRVPYLPSPDF